MYPLDATGLQALLFEELNAQIRNVTRQALVLLALNGLLAGLLALVAVLRRGLGAAPGEMGLLSLGVLAVAWACAAVSLVTRGPPANSDFPLYSSYEDYAQHMYRMTGDAIHKTLTYQTWSSLHTLRSKRIWSNISLMLSLVGLCMFLLFSLN